MASNEESLKALDGLMNEFFAPNTTNERKREIEEVLNNFSQQRDSWTHSLYFMAHTSNEYVMMYCMTVLENFIHRQWVGMQGENKIEIRNTLNNFLMSHHHKVPKYIRNKLIKLLVDIGKLDWPHFYPNFFSGILEHVQNSSTVVIGLIMLQTTSEELASPREDLSMARIEELHRLLLAQVPEVLTLLNGILSCILEKHRSFVSATPPPSPTRGGEEVTPRRSGIITNSPAKPSILSNMFKSPQSRVQTESLPPLDAQAQEVSMLALSCLSHLFSWIPLSSTITPNLLSTIFHFAAFGCESKPGNGSPVGSAHSSENTKNQQLGIMAMSCINELLSKNCVPQEFEYFLLQMFQQTFFLLQRITKDSTTHSSGNRLAQLDETYVDKFTEFLRLFVSIHLRRFETNAQFPVLEFLSLLFKYTFKQPNNEGYFSCLDIWNIFLDYLYTTNSLRLGAGDMISKYHDVLVSLAQNVLQKFQFKFNQSHLDELDDDTLDDDSETEWQHFLRQNLETLAKISDISSSITFTLLLEAFQENHAVYMGLEKHIVVSGGGEAEARELKVSAENDSRKLHCSLRDLSSMLQALGRLAHHFTGEKFSQCFSDAYTLIKKLIYTAEYSANKRLYELKGLAPVLITDFIEVGAQALAAVKANVSWLSQLYVEASGSQGEFSKCEALILSIVNTVLPLASKQIPEKLSHSAAHLTLSIFTTIKPALLYHQPSVQTFYDMVSSGGLQFLPFETQLLLYRSLSHYLLLPWPSLSENNQQWDVRGSSHKSFLAKLTQAYNNQLIADAAAETQLKQSKQLQDEAKPVVKKTLQMLTYLVETISVEGVSTSKKLCFQSMQNSTQTTLKLFPIYIHQADVTDEILGFFLALFQGFKIQMGVSFSEQIIQTFMSQFTQEQLTETILQESSAGNKVIEKFLKILQVIVMEPGSSFKFFLPNIISTCMDQIYPIIAERPSPDIKPTFYELLHQLLSHNWRYFFKVQVLTTFNVDKGEVMAHEEQFIDIMRSFGQSFLQPDIAVFRQNLEALENLNENRKLYNKKIVREVMLEQFLNVLLQVLLAKSHDLLSEEIGIVLYNMGSVDFDVFYKAFLPNFLASCDGLDDNQKQILACNFNIDRDLPSFTQSIQRFTKDLRYYRLINSSLPAGSVQL